MDTGDAYKALYKAFRMVTPTNHHVIITILKARMNADLHMADTLKNTGANTGNLFVIFGEPDIDVIPVGNDQIQVKIKGVDVFHPQSGEVQSGGPDDIAVWFIDTDYNEESFFVRHAYFLGANDPYSALKTTLKSRDRPGSLGKHQPRRLAPLSQTPVRAHRRQGHQPSRR